MGNTTKGIQDEINAAIRKPRIRGFEAKPLKEAKQEWFKELCYLHENDIDEYKSYLHMIRAIAFKRKNIQFKSI